jgi:hypothetical protein
VLDAGGYSGADQLRPFGAQEPESLVLVLGLSPQATHPRPSGAKTITYPC